MTQTTKDLMDALRSNDDDALETIGYLRMMDTETLAAAARGELDLNALASWCMADRGLDNRGNWVGFPEAERQHEARQTARNA